MIKCLIFDLDGTLFMTEKANFYAYRKAFQDIGVELKEERYNELFGLRADDLIRGIAPKLTETEIIEVRRKKSVYYREFVNCVEPNNALLSFIHLMKKNHKIVLVTTASRVNATFILDYFGVRDVFDVIIFGEDVKKGKPDPECYLTCIKKCGVMPEEFLIFEDSGVGVEAAIAAGVKVIKVEYH